jgi:hypothetical protein
MLMERDIETLLRTVDIILSSASARSLAVRRIDQTYRVCDALGLDLRMRK